LESVLLDNRAALLRFLTARGAGHEAEDLLQELWLKIPGTAAGPITDPLAYLYRAANNLMLDRRRSEIGRLARDRAWTDALETADGDPLGTPAGARAAIARQELALAEAALAELGDRTYYVFRRFRLDGAKQIQIALELGISLSSVEKHLQKAYRALIATKRKLDG